MTSILILTCIVSLLAISSLYLQKTNKKRWQSLLVIGALAILLCSLVLFIGAMSVFTEVAIGSFIGDGTLHITVQGQDVVMPVSCHWGPGIGFWLYVVSALILGSSMIIVVYQRRKKRNGLL